MGCVLSQASSRRHSLPFLSFLPRQEISCLYRAKSQALMSKALGSGQQDVLVVRGNAQCCVFLTKEPSFLCEEKAFIV